MRRPILLTLCLLSLVVSCGNTGDPDDEKEREDEVNQETQGYYETGLVPLNTGLAGSTSGTFNIRILGDQVRVRGSVSNSPSVFHRQFVHEGRNCPGPGADTNRDGILSFNESLAITGGALIPLDQNLSTQRAGYIFPVPRGGSYSYSETTSLVRMMADLQSADPDPSDFITKLEPDEGLALAGRVLMVYGVRGDSTLPIACGRLVRSVEPLPDGPVVTVPPREPPPPVIVLPPLVPWDDVFSTNVSSGLLISGTKCLGGERTEENWKENWICRRNQWIVRINDAEFIANLVLVREISTNTRAYYHIRPVTTVDRETFNVAREHWVRFERSFAPVVLRKPER